MCRKFCRIALTSGFFIVALLFFVEGIILETTTDTTIIQKFVTKHILCLHSFACALFSSLVAILWCNKLKKRHLPTTLLNNYS